MSIMKLSLKEGSIQQPRVILADWKEFNYDRQNFVCEVKVIFDKSQNILIYSAQDAGWKDCQQVVVLPNRIINEEEEILNIAQDNFNRLVLVENGQLQVISVDQEKAARVLQKNRKQEIIVKKQAFMVRLNNEQGQIEFVSGECQLIRIRNIFFLVLYRLMNDQYQYEFQSKFEIGRLKKEQKQNVIKNLGNILSTGVAIVNRKLVLDDIPDFTQSIDSAVKKMVYE